MKITIKKNNEPAQVQANNTVPGRWYIDPLKNYLTPLTDSGEFCEELNGFILFARLKEKGHFIQIYKCHPSVELTEVKADLILDVE